MSNDDETNGILAGAYKRAWKSNDSLDCLERSQRLYAKQWERSNGRNVWLGINAATTALLLDRRDACRLLAEETIKCLTDKAIALKHH